MAEELLKEFKMDISKLELLPGSGGVFEVNLNGHSIFSKKEQGRFPAEGEILRTIKMKTN